MKLVDHCNFDSLWQASSKIIPKVTPNFAVVHRFEYARGPWGIRQVPDREGDNWGVAPLKMSLVANVNELSSMG